MNLNPEYVQKLKDLGAYEKFMENLKETQKMLGDNDAITEEYLNRQISFKSFIYGAFYFKIEEKKYWEEICDK